MTTNAAAVLQKLIDKGIFANKSIESIVQSMIALSRVYIGLIDITQCTSKVRSEIKATINDRFDPMRWLPDPARHKFILRNPTISPPPGRVLPKTTKTWGHKGDLGLKAITLEIGTDEKGDSIVELALILSPQGMDNPFMQSGGELVVVRFDLDGSCRASTYTPVRIGPGADVSANSGQFLCYLLGMNELDAGHMEIIRSVDLQLFQGARTRLVQELPGLSSYFTDLVAVLLTADK